MATNQKSQGHNRDINSLDIILDKLKEKNPQHKVVNSFLRNLTCPECGQNEAWIRLDNPYYLKCPRDNKCGVTTRINDLYPEVFKKIKKYELSKSYEYLKKRAIKPEYFRYSFLPKMQRDKKNYCVITFPLSPSNKFHTGRLITDDKNLKNKGWFKRGSSPSKSIYISCDLQKDKEVWITESCIDAMSLTQSGFQAISVLSAGYKFSENPELIRLNDEKYKFVIAFDNDKAGIKGSKRLELALKGFGAEFRVAFPPENKDWNDLLKEGNLNSENMLTKDQVISEEDEIELESIFSTDNRIFWWVDDKGKHSLIYHKFHGFLEDNGFFRIRLSDGDDAQYKYVRIQDNIVEIVDKATIKNFVNDYLSFDISAQNFMKRGSDTYFSPGKLDYLKLVELKILEDTKNAAFYFFKNGIVQVTKSKIKLVDYKDLGKFQVWKSSIIDFNIKLGINEKSEIESFFEKTSTFGDNKDRNFRNLDFDCFTRKKSSFGYLLHRYKDVSVVRAVVAVDRNLDPESQESNGRTGKGLFFEAVRKLRNGLIIPSKDFDINNRFYFQSVKLDHQVINLDDIRRKFDFESLFPWISGDFKVEAKGSGNAQFIIPFKEAPKVLITSNFPLTGKGSSFEARQSVVEFSNYYDDQFQPFDDFNKTFFEDWNDREWLKFYNFSFECIQLFLEKGLNKALPNSYLDNKITALVRPELIDFLDFYFFSETNSEPFKIVEFTNTLDIWSRFKEVYDDFSSYKTKKLHSLMKSYAEHNGFKLIYHNRSNHKYHYIFVYCSEAKNQASWTQLNKDQTRAVSSIPAEFSLETWLSNLPGKNKYL